ncbi:sulfatase family protein [Methylovulum psychrotolerans]|uniref:Sulfatase n=1 Tax=Methylovulum psychrotolerans TaxID=1704499 RepID=A0A2S5CMN4_9GAMM|nr:sulfatase [Methylovulum psychrotolerans]POZ52079.1 sulfatase [Methylovulum psychrotolerans]
MKMAIRQRLLSVLLLFLPLIAWADNRLNIVVIVGDDWGGPYASAYTGIYGRALPSDTVKTPNIDRIARNGVLFKNAYVNAPSCTPSRSSIFSGRYFFNTGGGAFLYGTWDPTIPSFPLLLHDAGYHIGKTYKTWAPGVPIDAPFGGVKTYQYQQSGTSANRFSSTVTALMAKGMTFDQAKQTLLDEVNGNFSAFIKARKPGQPFLYWFGPTNTHRSWVKGSGKALWGIDPDNLKNKLRAFLPNVPEIREDMADYLGEIQALDAYVGVLLKKLEDIGELDKTLIVVTGDNGPGGFPHGKWNLYDFGVATPLAIWLPNSKAGRVVDDFTTLMDLAPTFLDVAGLPTPADMNGKSLLPVLTSPNSGQVDPQRNFVITGEERHVGMATEQSLPYPARALRTANYLYIRNFAPERWPMGCPLISPAPTPTPWVFVDMDPSPTKDWIINNRNVPAGAHFYTWGFAKRPMEELFDLSNDPGQITNVANKPAYATVKAQLAGQLLARLKNAGDPRVVGDGKTFDQPPFTSLASVACHDSLPLGWLANGQ